MIIKRLRNNPQTLTQILNSYLIFYFRNKTHFKLCLLACRDINYFDETNFLAEVTVILIELCQYRGTNETFFFFLNLLAWMAPIWICFPILVTLSPKRYIYIRHGSIMSNGYRRITKLIPTFRSNKLWNKLYEELKRLTTPPHHQK